MPSHIGFPVIFLFILGKCPLPRIEIDTRTPMNCCQNWWCTVFFPAKLIHILTHQTSATMIPFTWSAYDALAGSIRLSCCGLGCLFGAFKVAWMFSLVACRIWEPSMAGGLEHEWIVFPYIGNSN